MDDSLIRLRAKIAKQIAERESSIEPLRAYAILASATKPEELECHVALAALEQDLSGWKRMAARLETAVLFEPLEHRALALPPRR